MKYVVVDLEWNQPRREDRLITEPIRFDSEIIEIGAVRLNEDYAEEDEFKCYVRPQFYPVMNGGVASLTKIRMQALEKAPRFPEAWERFADWCGEAFCLCTWGGDDVPVLMDNLLMHGLETPERLLSCDLQEVFGREIMRDRRRWSLESAVETLGLPKDRAHDALNDVRNTCRVCERVDLYPYADDYIVVSVDYGRDKLSGVLTGRPYGSLEEALEDEELRFVRCPWCGERVRLDDFARESGSTLLGSGRCAEGDEFLGVFRCRRSRDSQDVTVSRAACEMTDALWERYRDALDPAETGEEQPAGGTV